MTFTLLTTSEGKKMGKTQGGAVWLDPKKTSPYDFYQYWRNVGDQDVIRCLKMLTFLPMEEIRELKKLEGQEINTAKKILAYEVTSLVHGKEEAEKAQNAAQALFEAGGASENIPGKTISDDFETITALDLISVSGIVPSRGEGRRLITQGGLTINDEKITSIDHEISRNDFGEEGLMIKKGKKHYFKVTLAEK